MLLKWHTLKFTSLSRIFSVMATEDIWISGKLMHCLVFVYDEIGGESKKKAVQFFTLHLRERKCLRNRESAILKCDQKRKRSWKRSFTFRFRVLREGVRQSRSRSQIREPRSWVKETRERKAPLRRVALPHSHSTCIQMEAPSLTPTGQTKWPTDFWQITKLFTMIFSTLCQIFSQI